MLSRAKAGRISAAVLLAVVMALGGCGAGPQQGPSSGESSTPSPGLETKPAWTAGATSETSGQNNSGPLAWLPPGPVDPADPPQSQWYLLLANKDCNGLAVAVDTGNASTDDGLALWGAAAAVCRAVYQGQSSGWTDAAAGLAPLQEPEPERCLDRAAYQLVAALLAVHAQDPAAAPDPVAGTGTACPLGLTGLDALDGEGPTATPSSGLAGGRFQLAGRFQDVVAVVVGGQRVAAEADPEQPGRWNVAIPAVDAASTVTVTAEGSAGPIPGSLTFTYLDATGASPSEDNPTSDPPRDLPATLESGG
ncbi:hypothetical protein [Arthrobacter sp. HLT1-20]